VKDEAKPAPPTWTSSRLLRVAAALPALILTAYLLLPILTPVHVEGFTASVASLAMHLSQDNLANFDRHQPMVGELYGLTKLGWLLATAAIAAALNISATAAMTLLTWISAPVFAGCCVYLVSKWTRCSPILAFFIIILMPGAVESAFFLNDNLFACALFTAALSALYLPQRSAGAILCGTLLGAAILTRTDMVLMSVMVPLIIFERTDPDRKKLIDLAFAGAICALTVIVPLAIFHATPMDVLKVGSSALKYWDRPTDLLYVGVITFYFLGPALTLLVLGGTVPTVRSLDRWAVARTVLVPIIFISLLFDRLWEIRQLLPLTPLFASLTIVAVRALLEGPRTRISAVLHGGLFALLIYSLFGPIAGYIVKDGPRVMAGRFANVSNWRTWQYNMSTDLRLLHNVSNIPSGATRIVIIEHWNEDRYIHLALQEEGYRISRGKAASCVPISDLYAAPNRRIYVIRPQVRISLRQADFTEQMAFSRFSREGLACIASVRPNDVVFVGPENRLSQLMSGATSEQGTSPVTSEDPNHYWPLQALKLDAPRLARLLAGYRRVSAEERDKVGPAPPFSESSLRLPAETHFGF